MASTAADLPLEECATVDVPADDRVEADREVFARSATIRRLSSAKSRQGSFRRPSLLLGAASTPQLPASSPLRRPATAAAATHSRVHQALRQTENEFEYSTKQSTLNGLCYSSRFPVKDFTAKRGNHLNAPLLRPSSSVSVHGASSEATVESSPSTESPTEASDPTVMDIQAKKKELRKKLLAERARSASPSLLSTSSSESALKAPAQVVDEAAFTLRKRRCAKTFEDMIAVRLKPQDPTADAKPLQTVDTEKGKQEALTHTKPQELAGITKLLEQGIIQSVLALSSSSDGATQTHCCRALYYLSRVTAARKPMISSGVVASLKQLARITLPAPRQDMAATLCHLSEEENVVEVLFFEGIDRSILRLITSPSWETKRICALTTFNLSADARHIKHFREVFSQLLIAATKTNSGIGGSSLFNLSSSAGLTSSSAYLIKAVYNASLVPVFHNALLGENIPRFIATHLPDRKSVV